MGKATLIAACLFQAAAMVAQVPNAIEGYFNPQAGAFAVKSCSILPGADGTSALRTALWHVSVPDQPESYADYFGTFSDGRRVQVETTLTTGTSFSRTLLFDPTNPKVHFVQLRIRPAHDKTECKGDPVAEFSTALGEFVSCSKDETSQTVAFNRTFLLAPDDEIWINTLCRVAVGYFQNRQFLLSKLTFLRSLLDPHATLLASPPPSGRQTAVCRYGDIKDEVSANFRPRSDVEAIYVQWARKSTP